MSDELKRIEVELAKVRLAKEQLELRDALQRAERKQKLADGADKILNTGRSAVHSSAAAIAQRTPKAPVPWGRVFAVYGVALVLFVVYATGLPESKSNALAVAFFASLAFAGYGTLLLVQKLLQLLFRSPH
jgi:hypothetical protein